MVSILTHRDRQALQHLSFCYMCGKEFRDGEERPNRDHVPPKTCFNPRDRFPLILPSHEGCNSARSVSDKQIGQLIGMKLGKVPSRRDRSLDIKHYGPRISAVVNLDIPGEVWRWIQAFHAALYQAPYRRDPLNARGALITPFPHAQFQPGHLPILNPIKPQHLFFVDVIKANRARKNLDVICCNNEKLIYECVWHQTLDKNWICIFAIDIYGWKDLGNSLVEPSRGCAGCYVLPSGEAPQNATRAVRSSIVIPNIDPLDPFAP